MQVDEATLRRIHLAPYADAIAAGVATIMPSYSSWNGEKCSGSKRLLTEILKDELGFQGFLISDYAAIDQLPGDYRSDVKQSINAGMDMVMVPQKYQEFIATLKSLVEAGEVAKARIDDAVRRILRVKFAMGLKPGRARGLGRRAAGELRLGRAPRGGAARGARVAGAAEEREARAAAREEPEAHPRGRPRRRRHADAGRGLDRLLAGAARGRQAGGPDPGNDDPGGDQGGRARRPRRVTFSKDGSGAEGADAVVVVVGEEPYAEFEGDRSDLSLGQADKDAIAAARKAGKPLVVVLLSGRPMVVTDELGAGRRLRGGLAARDRGRGRRRRAVRRPQADRQAADELAAHERPDPDERRRRHLRPALQVRLRADVLTSRSDSHATSGTAGTPGTVQGVRSRPRSEASTGG